MHPQGQLVVVRTVVLGYDTNVHQVGATNCSNTMASICNCRLRAWRLSTSRSVAPGLELMTHTQYGGRETTWQAEHPNTQNAGRQTDEQQAADLAHPPTMPDMKRGLSGGRCSTAAAMSSALCSGGSPVPNPHNANPAIPSCSAAALAD
jgi:hypothetical protein